jgi:hypothetical protein
MSEIITPNKTIVDFKGKAVTAEEEPKQEQKPTQLPEVKGYRILCAVPEVADKYESGLIKADKTRHIEEHSTVVLFVIKVG